MVENEKLVPTNEGYVPVNKGYQPVEGGYIPTTSQGDNPANQPAPPPSEE